jgi:hypothetical protein
LSAAFRGFPVQTDSVSGLRIFSSPASHGQNLSPAAIAVERLPPTGPLTQAPLLALTGPPLSPAATGLERLPSSGVLSFTSGSQSGSDDSLRPDVAATGDKDLPVAIPAEGQPKRSIGEMLDAIRGNMGKNAAGRASEKPALKRPAAAPSKAVVPVKRRSKPVHSGLGCSKCRYSIGGCARCRVILRA